MMTCEAPIALATSKQTNPIGPVEREEINNMSVVEIHQTCDHMF